MKTIDSAYTTLPWHGQIGHYSYTGEPQYISSNGDDCEFDNVIQKTRLPLLDSDYICIKAI